MSKVLLFVVFVLSSVSVVSRGSENPILRFREVSPGIYRGARPEKAGVEHLKKLGFKTILNIDNDVYAVAEELRHANKMKIKTLNYPLSSWAFPTDAEVDQILRELNNPDNHPIFLHCQHGQDRTGMITALYRVEYQGWGADVAYREARNLGFHRSLIFLYEYYKYRTGFRRLWDEEGEIIDEEVVE